MLNYDYFQPTCLLEALDILDRYQGKIKIIAGGTDLLVQMREDSSDFKEMDYVLDISGLHSLKKIEETEEYLEIGALITHSEIVDSEIIQNNCNFLNIACGTVGAVQIRNLGTIGGSLANASPAADPLTPLIAGHAKVEIYSKEGVRVEPLESIFAKAYKLNILQNEMITKVLIPKEINKYQTSFVKLGRRKALAISRLNVSAALKFNLEGRIVDARIVPGCIFQVPGQVESAEEMLIGEIPNSELFLLAGKEVVEEMIRRTGYRWSTEYKAASIPPMVMRALQQASGGA